VQIDSIEIHTGSPSFEYTPVRHLEAKCEAATALHATPTIEDANLKLRELAARVGANAIVDVRYESGMSLTSWKSMKATGLAVRRVSDEMACPVCAETIKRAAQRCRFCGGEVSETVAARRAPEPRITPRVSNPEPLRSTNNPTWWLPLIVGVLFLLFTMMSL
jgi:hypothetical protein